MIKSTPSGWTDTRRMTPFGRCYIEDTTGLQVCYLLSFTSGAPADRWPRSLTFSGSPSDNDCARALEAFNMTEAFEIADGVGRRFRFDPE